MSVAVLVPTIPPRAALLGRALASVARQTRLPDQVVVVTDHERRGAPAMLNRGLRAVDCEWVTFLNDDDELLGAHCKVLEEYGRITGTDVLYPDFEVMHPPNPYAAFVNKPFDPDLLRRVNYIHGGGAFVRTEAIRSVGGFPEPAFDGTWRPEDWGLWLRLLDAGARFLHVPEVTWRWNNAPTGHTRGRPDEWPA